MVLTAENTYASTACGDWSPTSMRSTFWAVTTPFCTASFIMSPCSLRRRGAAWDRTRPCRPAPCKYLWPSKHSASMTSTVSDGCRDHRTLAAHRASYQRSATKMTTMPLAQTISGRCPRNLRRLQQFMGEGKFRVLIVLESGDAVRCQDKFFIGVVDGICGAADEASFTCRRGPVPCPSGAGRGQ